MTDSLHITCSVISPKSIRTQHIWGQSYCALKRVSAIPQYQRLLRDRSQFRSNNEGLGAVQRIDLWREEPYSCVNFRRRLRLLIERNHIPIKLSPEPLPSHKRGTLEASRPGVQDRRQTRRLQLGVMCTSPPRRGTTSSTLSYRRCSARPVTHPAKACKSRSFPLLCRVAPKYYCREWPCPRLPKPTSPGYRTDKEGSNSTTPGHPTPLHLT